MKITLPFDENKVQEQQQQAKELLPKAAADVKRFQRELEEKYGTRIEVREEPGGQQRARSRLKWQDSNAPDHHVVGLNSLSDWERPHLLCHELLHIALESEADAACVRRLVFFPPDVRTRLAKCLPPGISSGIVHTLCEFTQNAAVDMVVESRLHTDFPNLRPAQAVFLNRAQFDEIRQGFVMRKGDLKDPRCTYLEGAMAARALFKDRLFGTTSYFEHWDGRRTKVLAERLYNAFATASPCPGWHYDLILRWDELAGLSGIHVMDPRPVWEVEAEYRAAAARTAPIAWGEPS